MKQRTFTRRDFLKVAGAGAAGATMLGAAGCGSLVNSFTQVPDEYLPSGGSRMNVILVIIDSLRRDHLGVYGNEWIKTPTSDALARESLRFDRSYPESLPTIPAARDPHGDKDVPFQGLAEVVRRGCQPLGAAAHSQRTGYPAEILLGEGFYNLMVTDTLHQFRPFYDMHRGFHAFDFIRGQERPLQASFAGLREEDGEHPDRGPERSALRGDHAPVLREHRGPPEGGRLVRPAGVHQGGRVPGDGEGEPAFLHVRRQLRPARAVGPATEVHRPLQRRLRRPRASDLQQRSSDWLISASSSGCTRATPPR